MDIIKIEKRLWNAMENTYAPGWKMSGAAARTGRYHEI